MILMLLELCATGNKINAKVQCVICEHVIKCHSLSSMEETYVGPLESAFVFMWSFML